ncbi:MAG TPA: M20/M25/M40 family metallo-hydrolase [Gemmatimonadaceae bacterium]|nr:M20/M25/M40 family metallo-hydrolase [Gemmatimonadaceae bacterium]
MKHGFRAILLYSLMFGAAACAGRQVQVSTGSGVTSPAITAGDLRTRLYIYAADSMEGRRIGYPGELKATRYIAAELQRMGVEPGGENGTYFQDIHPDTIRGRPRGTVLPPGTARNVIGIIRGSDPVLRNEFVAIGAHSDHIGIRATAADYDSLRAFNIELDRTGNPMWDRRIPAEKRTAVRASIKVNVDSLRRIRPAHLDSINNGADDDGSGTVAALEIAQALAASAVKPKRSIIFVWHTGEEAGLLGSKWFTDHPTIPRESIVAQLNMDMIGRGEAIDLKEGSPEYLQLVGSRRVSTELGDLVEKINSERSQPFKFDYQYDMNGDPNRIYCRSDHQSYARYGIPITFFTTGLHADYHQVTDEPQYISYGHLARVAEFVRDIAVRVANLDHRVVVDKPVGDPTAACVQ